MQDLREDIAAILAIGAVTLTTAILMPGFALPILLLVIFAAISTCGIRCSASQEWHLLGVYQDNAHDNAYDKEDKKQ